jgi:hypothetical protein
MTCFKRKTRVFNKLSASTPKLLSILSLLISASLCIPANAEIALTVESGITPEVEAEVHNTIREFSAVLKDEADIMFETNVQVMLVPSKERYEQLLRERGGFASQEASITSEVTGGVCIPHKNLVLLYLKDTIWMGRLRLITAHELTHVLQNQLAKNSSSFIKAPRWLSEGMADWVAGLVSQRMGTKTMATWKDELLDSLSGSRNMLKPTEVARANLNDWVLWNKQKRRPYEYASLMMLSLAERNNTSTFPSLTSYFRCLNSFSFEATCFRESFGVKEDDFYQEFSAYMASELSGL